MLRPRFFLFFVLSVSPLAALGDTPSIPAAQSQANALRESQKIQDQGVRSLMQYALKSANLKGYPASFVLPIFSPDGKTLIYTDYSRGSSITHVLRWESGKIKRVLVRAYSDAPKSLPFLNTIAAAFSPDGSLLATIESRGPRQSPGIPENASSIWLWNTRTWKVARVFTGHFHSISSLAFSANGRRLLSGDKGGGAIIHDVKTGKVLTDWNLNNDYKRLFVAFGQVDGKEQALALTANNYNSRGQGDGSEEEAGLAIVTQLWNIESGQLLHEFLDDPDTRMAAFSPGASRLALSGYSGSTPDLKPITYLKMTTLTDFSQESSQIRDYYYLASLTYTPDGKNLIASALGGDYQFLQVYDAMQTKMPDENSSVLAPAQTSDSSSK